MGISGVPEGGDQVVKKTSVNSKEVKQKREDAIQQGYTKGMQDYFKHAEKKELINEKKAITEQMLELSKRHEELKKQIEAEKKELKALEELRAKDMEADLAKTLMETHKKLAEGELQLQELSPKEKAKAELRKLESEYNKNYEKMTSEEIIEMEFKMDAIKKDLATGKYDKPQEDSHLVGVDMMMLNNYNIQKQEIEEELKNVGQDFERKTVLETRLAYLESQISELQDKIKKDFDAKMFPDSAE